MADLPPGMTPRLLSREEAARYCGGVAPETFESHVPVQPVRIGRRCFWDVKSLDRWLDQQSGLVEALTPAAEWLGRLRSDRPREGG